MIHHFDIVNVMDMIISPYGNVMYDIYAHILTVMLPYMLPVRRYRIFHSIVLDCMEE